MTSYPHQIASKLAEILIRRNELATAIQEAAARGDLDRADYLCLCRDATRDEEDALRAQGSAQ